VREKQGKKIAEASRNLPGQFAYGGGMTIREKVAEAISYATVHGRPDPGQLYQCLATAAIDAFLAAAAESGWHMRPDKASKHWKGKDYIAMLTAAPKFEWDK
jgi:hypothetical protein